MSSADTLLQRQADAVLLLKPEAVAGMLSIGVRTLWRWASEGTFPQPDVRQGERVVRWKRQTVLDWIEANTVSA